jgi:hypothetical protein
VSAVSYLPILHDVVLKPLPSDCLQSFQSAGIALPPGCAGGQGWLPIIRFRHHCHALSSLVLHAAAACPIFGRRAVHAGLHYLQPPAMFTIRPSQRALEFAVKLWPDGGRGACRKMLHRQRLQLLCCSCPLSALAFRLARVIILNSSAIYRHEGSRSRQQWVVSLIMRRCLRVCLWRLWTFFPRFFSS